MRAGVPAANILYAIELCRARRVARGYVVTKALDDFGPVADLPDTAARILRIPAPLLCYWMGATE